MVKVALFVTLEAKQGKENEVENFLRGALPLVQEEPNTINWYALKISPSTFGIFDTFPHDASRKSHLVGKVATKLMAITPDLLAEAPQIEFIDILEVK
jgi:quinol monooxygenase YgiN